MSRLARTYSWCGHPRNSNSLWSFERPGCAAVNNPFNDPRRLGYLDECESGEYVPFPAGEVSGRRPFQSGVHSESASLCYT